MDRSETVKDMQHILVQPNVYYYQNVLTDRVTDFMRDYSFHIHTIMIRVNIRPPWQEKGHISAGGGGERAAVKEPDPRAFGLEGKRLPK